MMSNVVVKKYSINDIYGKFLELLSTSQFNNLARSSDVDFTRKRSLTLERLILYLIFRQGRTLNQELLQFYAAADENESIVSKQALSKALRKINPDALSHLIMEFARLFYNSSAVKTYRKYILLAEDGSTIEAPLSDTSLNVFGFQINQYVRTKEQAKKTSSKMGGLFDITNGFFINATMGSHNDSEIPLGYKNLEGALPYLKNRKVIYMTDRYYGSIELFQFLENHSFNYCVRGKANFYKDLVANIEDDDWISIRITSQILQRIKNEKVRIALKKKKYLNIRVVKYYLEKPNKDGETYHLYFTNLSKKEFSSQDIADLYSKRWEIETNYKFFKIDLEAERFNTNCPRVFKCKVMGKLLALNFIGIIKAEVDAILIHKKTLKYRDGFKTKFCVIKDFVYNNFLSEMIQRNLTSLKGLVVTIHKYSQKNIVPIRKNRHYRRYGRFVKSAPSYRFTLDGRNHPKLRSTKFGMRTVAS